MTNPSPITLDRAKIEADTLREYLKLKYMGDCKCGHCQLVPAEVIEHAAAVLEALSRAAPSGSDMVLVPREPTMGMLIDGSAASRDWLTEKGQYPRTQAVWKAMLAAAPPAPLTPSPLLVNVHPDGRVTYLDGRPVPLAATQPQGADNGE